MEGLVWDDPFELKTLCRATVGGGIYCLAPVMDHAHYCVEHDHLEQRRRWVLKKRRQEEEWDECGDAAENDLTNPWTLLDYGEMGFGDS